MKKICSLFLTFILIFQCAVTTFSVGEPVLALSEATGKRGADITVEVHLKNPKDIKALQFKILFDTQVLSLKADGIEKAKLSGFLFETADSDGEIRAALASQSGFSEVGKTKILTLSFTIRSNAPLGVSALTVSEGKAYLSETEPSELQISNGSVFVKSSGDGTITVRPEEKPDKEWKTFEDIQNHWAKNEIEFLANRGIVDGVSENFYMPDIHIKRGDFIKLLMELEEKKDPGEESFSDVVKSAYYYEHIMTAKKLGIAKGIGDNCFMPEAEITREDAMSLLYRTAEATAKPFGKTADLSAFHDMNEISNYAEGAVTALVAEGIVQGDDTKAIRPKASITRAEAARILYLYLLYSNSETE